MTASAARAPGRREARTSLVESSLTRRLQHALAWFEEGLQCWGRESAGLALPCAQSLLLLRIGEGVDRQADLAAELEVSKQAVQQAVRELAARGLVRLESGAGDARQKRVVLTRRGEAAQQALGEGLARLEAELGRRIGVELVERLDDALSAGWGAAPAGLQASEARTAAMRSRRAPERARDPARELPYADRMRSVGHLARIVFREFSSELGRRLARDGVTPGQWRFLRVLWEEDAITQRELSQRVGAKEATTARSIRSLLRSGLVERRDDPLDKRKFMILLTRRARRLEGKLLPYVTEVHEVALRGIEPEEVEVACSVLTRIHANFAAHGKVAALDESAVA
jgi:DNA-binding MarR family transcriptional regulator